MSKNIGKNITKYSQEFLEHAKQSAIDALKTASNRAIQKTVEETGDLTDVRLICKQKKNQ